MGLGVVGEGAEDDASAGMRGSLAGALESRQRGIPRSWTCSRTARGSKPDAAEPLPDKVHRGTDLEVERELDVSAAEVRDARTPGR